MMKRLVMVGLLVAFAALPTAALAEKRGPETSHKQPPKADKEKKDKSVPEPATMLLVGAAAAGLFGARKLQRRRHR